MSLEARIEAILFAAGEAVSLEELGRALGEEAGLSIEAVAAAVARIQADFGSRNGGFHLVEVAGGFEFRTRVEYAQDIHRFRQRRPVALSSAAMECLAIVAYRQPCTRALIDRLRGVDSSAALRTLLQRGLVVGAGRAPQPGRPRLYQTSAEFLRVFGLRSLEALPDVGELNELQLSLDLPDSGDEVSDEDDQPLS